MSWCQGQCLSDYISPVLFCSHVSLSCRDQTWEFALWGIAKMCTTAISITHLLLVFRGPHFVQAPHSLHRGCMYKSKAMGKGYGRPCGRLTRNKETVSPCNRLWWMIQSQQLKGEVHQIYSRVPLHMERDVRFTDCCGIGIPLLVVLVVLNNMWRQWPPLKPLCILQVWLYS